MTQIKGTMYSVTYLESAPRGERPAKGTRKVFTDVASAKIYAKELVEGLTENAKICDDPEYVEIENVQTGKTLARWLNNLGVVEKE